MPGPGCKNDRGYNQNEIGPSSLQRSLHTRLEKGRKTHNFKDHAELEALMDRRTRRAGEIAQMDAKIVMSLETKEDILKDTELALLFQDNISDWQFKIKQFLKSKQETPVSQFYHSSFKQAPTSRMHINLPKINIKERSSI